MKNYIRINGRFSYTYLYLDTDDYLADSLFYKRKIPVKFKNEFVNENEKYRFITCKIRKKYKEDFEKALEELRSKMLLCGHTDYDERCDTIMREMFGEETEE